MDRIVFNQAELDKINTQNTTVALCDNTYAISPAENAVYIAIGEVSAVVECSAIEALSMGMSFIGFTPVFSGKKPVKEAIKQYIPAVTSFVSSFASSFSASFTTSYKSSFTTSFATSFSAMHEFEYEYRTSFATSFSGSFGSSFKNVSSFGVGSMRAVKKQVVRKIAVNGYGLDLI